MANTAAIVAVMVALGTAPASAQDRPAEAHIYVQNHTDKWLSVEAQTPYKLAVETVRTWCIDPRRIEKHGVTALIVQLKFRLMENDCHAPVHDSVAIPYTGYAGHISIGTFLVTTPANATKLRIASSYLQ